MKVEFRGIDSLVSELNKMSDMRKVKDVVSRNTQQLEVKMKRAAKFTKGYETGETRDSIESVMKDGSYTGVVRPTSEHAPFLIYGTRFMEAQDFMRPALYAQRQIFLSDIERMFK